MSCLAASISVALYFLNSIGLSMAQKIDTKAIVAIAIMESEVATVIIADLVLSYRSFPSETRACANLFDF
jgi:hypothetical protein